MAAKRQTAEEVIAAGGVCEQAFTGPWSMVTFPDEDWRAIGDALRFALRHSDEEFDAAKRDQLRRILDAMRV